MRGLFLALTGVAIAVAGMAIAYPLVWGIYRTVTSPPGEKLEALLEGLAWFVLVVGTVGVLIGKLL